MATRVITLRISETDGDLLAEKLTKDGLTLRKLVENYVHGATTKEVVKEVPSKSDCGSMSPALYKDLMSMLKPNELDYERFMEIIDKLMNDGSIIVSPDSVVTTDSRVNVSALIDRCDEAGIKNYQAVFDKMIKALRFT